MRKPSLYDREKYVTTLEALGKLLTTTSTCAKNSIDLLIKSPLVFIQTSLRGPEAKVKTFAENDPFSSQNKKILTKNSKS